MNSQKNDSIIVLIAGGAGFIGSNLCRRLLKEGNKVICLDNLFTGKMENIEDITQQQKPTEAPQKKERSQAQKAALAQARQKAFAVRQEKHNYMKIT